METRENGSTLPLLDNNVHNDQSFSINGKLNTKEESEVKLNEDNESLKMEKSKESLSQEKIPYLKVGFILYIKGEGVVHLCLV